MSCAGIDVSTPATAPEFGLRRKFNPVSVVTRMRSTDGLKSKPKFPGGRSPTPAKLPTAPATPVRVEMT